MKVNDKVLFVTGTRADYGKLKSLISISEKYFEVHILITGMHLLEQYGETYKEVIADGYENIHLADIDFSNKMDLDLANTITFLSEFIEKIKPDLIVCHGDRIDALAASISGMLNNILVAHIEGGEVTGTVDESIRHAVTKMANYHFVANYESKLRVLQLGELEKNIHIIGSPDIDIMLSELPDIRSVKTKYKIPFDEYAIFMYHPVTTEIDTICFRCDEVFEAVKKSEKNFIIVYPNNDTTAEVIIDYIGKVEQSLKCMAFKSINFEDFLTLLKHSEFIIGNSSAGIREACIYGIPTINIGTRQNGRVNDKVLKNIQNVSENVFEILSAIDNVNGYKIRSDYFGKGNSAELFLNVLLDKTDDGTQKKFVDSLSTKKAIDSYINEVCF